MTKTLKFQFDIAHESDSIQNVIVNLQNDVAGAVVKKLDEKAEAWPVIEVEVPESAVEALAEWYGGSADVEEFIELYGI
jgi:hypothetical protein